MQGMSDFQSDFSICFIVDLLMQHEFCCVNLIGWSRRTWKRIQITPTHLKGLLYMTSWGFLIPYKLWPNPWLPHGQNFLLPHPFTSSLLTSCFKFISVQHWIHFIFHIHGAQAKVCPSGLYMTSRVPRLSATATWHNISPHLFTFDPFTFQAFP